MLLELAFQKINRIHVKMYGNGLLPILESTQKGKTAIFVNTNCRLVCFQPQNSRQKNLVFWAKSAPKLSSLYPIWKFIFGSFSTLPQFVHMPALKTDQRPHSCRGRLV